MRDRHNRGPVLSVAERAFDKHGYRGRGPERGRDGEREVVRTKSHTVGYGIARGYIRIHIYIHTILY